MSDAHEAHLAEVLGGKVMPGSGNQWNNQMDVRQSHHHLTFAIAADGKSTFGKSISVTREMWDKAVEQSHGERAVLPLRFYDTERLKVGIDLVVLSLDDFAELLEAANGNS